MKAKKWLVGWLLLVLIPLCIIGMFVYKIDPYFHYHKPDTRNYFYSLDNQRSQNDGITKHFDYDALVTGTSMTENFKTSEVDKIFGAHSIKVSYSGGSYKEMNDNLIIALKNNPNLKTIIRCLDYDKILDDKDHMRSDLGSYPTYLYDDNPFNDVKYVFNKDVIFSRVYSMIVRKCVGDCTPGITTFDDYSRWQYSYTFGVKTVLPNGVNIAQPPKPIHLTDADKQIIYGNITQNVTSLADKYPNVDFYYFFSPYSVVWWNDLVNAGTVYKRIEAEQYVIELILEHPNIHLFSFNNRTDITTSLNHYKDSIHYGQWINSLMLKWMKNGDYLLTKDNYKEYIEKELEFYTTYDYAKLSKQDDYESDFYAAALLNQELTGAEPILLLTRDSLNKVELSSGTSFVAGYEYGEGIGIQCKGSLQREAGSNVSVADYLFNNAYIGAKIKIGDLSKHNYLVFYGKKISDHGQPSVYVYNDKNQKVAELTASYQSIDNEWHQYVLDLSGITGEATVIFNGGYIDNTGSADSNYIFNRITLY